MMDIVEISKMSIRVLHKMMAEYEIDLHSLEITQEESMAITEKIKECSIKLTYDYETLRNSRRQKKEGK